MGHYFERHAPSTKFPRIPLFGAAAMIVLAIFSAAEARINGGENLTAPTSAPLLARDLTFQDEPNGAIRVFDAKTKAAVTTIEPATNGFLRALLRGQANRRKFSGDADITFHITAWADGRLTLDDPLSGKPIDLEAFGPTNEEAFVKLLYPDHGAS